MSRQEQKKAEARLIEAAEAGDAEGVKAALAAGARTEVSDASGRTPLLLASLGDHVAAARVLVEAGADPDAQDDRDDSAWLVTGVTGSVEMMRTLLRPSRTRPCGTGSAVPRSSRPPSAGTCRTSGPRCGRRRWRWTTSTAWGGPRSWRR
ncbi:ankyrin repeat domain-containing protein [Actinomadura keratinilytica]